ncbi:MAG: PAS domain S-box protein [Planctomycetes bacterium]|nr:PAS domain S-box protein [Planctomycetota bacterium]
MPSSRRDLSRRIEDADKAKLFTELIEKLNLGLSFEEIFSLIYERLSGALPYNRFAVALLDEPKRRLSMVAARSDGPTILREGYSADITGGSLEPLLRERKSRIIGDLRAYLAGKPDSESTRLIVREGMCSSLTLPLIAHGEAIGVMFFSSRHPDVYRPQHEEFLRGIVGHVAVAIERARLLEQLREKTEFLESVLNHSADAIVVVDTRNRIRSWNEGARRMFGYEPHEAIGADYSMFLPPELQGTEEATRIKNWVEREGFVTDHECERMAKSGRRLTVNVTSTLVSGRDGRVLGRSCIVRDVTHLKQLQAEVIRSRSLAAVGEMAAVIAHEIKNPLAGISGAIQVLREAIPLTDSRRDVVGEILEQIRRLDDTVRDLLLFARPAMPDRVELAVEDSIHQAWELLACQPGATRVRLLLEGARGVRVAADPRLLNQVWINLLQNAIEAMPEGGDVVVRISDATPIRVELTDTGTGVSPSNARRLFEPFFSTKTRGTGLGLAISRKIMEAHGGTIGIQSDPGKGTRVILEIPR